MKKSILIAFILLAGCAFAESVDIGKSSYGSNKDKTKIVISTSATIKSEYTKNEVMLQIEKLKKQKQEIEILLNGAENILKEMNKLGVK